MRTKMADEKCAASVHDGGNWPSFHRCGRTASVQRDGKHYCKTHDPKRKEAARAAWDAAFDETQAAQDRVGEIEKEIDRRSRKAFPDLYKKLAEANKVLADAELKLKTSHRTKLESKEQK